MSLSRADVATPHASRYLQQLCKHWAHKFQVEFTPQEGAIDFGDGRSCELTARDRSLEVRAIADDAEALPKLEEIIERHIQRFAHREGELVFVWSPPEG